MTDILDTQGMFDVTSALAEQVFDAAVRARGLSDLPDRELIEHVVVLGMGGSGVAGNILAAAAGPFLPVPVIVSKGYELPAFVGESSLVFAISCSGNTEETVEAATAAAVEGARLVVITAGGELGKLAASWGVPIVTVPTDIPQPRAAVGAMAIPPFIVLEEIGLFPGAQQWIDFAVEQLTERREELTTEGNPAQELARAIGRTVPLVYGGGQIGATAAMRWKTQVNENANGPAFWNTLPELCHNEIQGWGQNGDLTRQAFTQINLRHEFEHPQVVRRFEVIEPLMDEVVSAVHEVEAKGEGHLAQLLDLILFGDFVSLYLAAQEGIDPGPVDTLTSVKKAVAAS
ncbi:MAG: bifunctional phosphoglucose/phosphomannose isomerase [Acidobacteria bacterium]|nr:bifunctional phosphoglucose/phosphomannose isomerase [Acidobacteriota bacterium]